MHRLACWIGKQVQTDSVFGEREELRLEVLLVHSVLWMLSVELFGVLIVVELGCRILNVVVDCDLHVESFSPAVAITSQLSWTQQRLLDFRVLAKLQTSLLTIFEGVVSIRGSQVKHVFRLEPSRLYRVFHSFDFLIRFCFLLCLHRVFSTNGVSVDNSHLLESFVCSSGRCLDLLTHLFF